MIYYCNIDWPKLHYFVCCNWKEFCQFSQVLSCLYEFFPRVEYYHWRKNRSLLLMYLLFQFCGSKMVNYTSIRIPVWLISADVILLFLIKLSSLKLSATKVKKRDWKLQYPPGHWRNFLWMYARMALNGFLFVASENTFSFHVLLANQKPT